MCVMLVMCFLVDPLSLLGGGDASDGPAHGSQRTLSSVVNDAAEGEEFVFSYSWCLVWSLRLFFAGLCFGWVWLRSLPTHNPEWEGVRFWRLRKQAEKDIKNVRLFSLSLCIKLLTLSSFIILVSFPPVRVISLQLKSILSLL